MSLVIVILNYRTPQLTLDCLDSLSSTRQEIPGTRVIVVEHGSGDSSAKILADAIAARGWESWVRLMVLSENFGFSGGNNRALERIPTDYPDAEFVLLLNNDTLVRPGALALCHQVMTAQPDIGVMSCRLIDPDGTVQNAPRRFPTPFRQTLCALGLPWLLPRLFAWADVYYVPPELLERQHDCDWLCGAFLFVRAAVLQRIGLLDECFIFYGDDVEFCHRFHKAGCRVHYDPAAAVVHLGGGSTDPVRVPALAQWRRLNLWRSRYLVQRRCYGRAAAWMVRAADILALGLRKLKMSCTGARTTDKYREVSDSFAMLLRPLH